MQIVNEGNRLWIEDAGRTYEIVSDPPALRYLEEQLTTRGIGVVPVPGGVVSNCAGGDEFKNDVLPLPEIDWSEPTGEKKQTVNRNNADDCLPLPEMVW